MTLVHPLGRVRAVFCQVISFDRNAVVMGMNVALYRLYSSYQEVTSMNMLQVDNDSTLLAVSSF